MEKFDFFSMKNIGGKRFFLKKFELFFRKNIGEKRFFLKKFELFFRKNIGKKKLFFSKSDSTGLTTFNATQKHFLSVLKSYYSSPDPSNVENQSFGPIYTTNRGFGVFPVPRQYSENPQIIHLICSEVW